MGRIDRSDGILIDQGLVDLVGLLDWSIGLFGIDLMELMIGLVDRIDRSD